MRPGKRSSSNFTAGAACLQFGHSKSPYSTTLIGACGSPITGSEASIGSVNSKWRWLFMLSLCHEASHVLRSSMSSDTFGKIARRYEYAMRTFAFHQNPHPRTGTHGCEECLKLGDTW